MGWFSSFKCNIGLFAKPSFRTKWRAVSICVCKTAKSWSAINSFILVCTELLIRLHHRRGESKGQSNNFKTRFFYFKPPWCIKLLWPTSLFTASSDLDHSPPPFVSPFLVPSLFLPSSTMYFRSLTNNPAVICHALNPYIQPEELLLAHKDQFRRAVYNIAFTRPSGM